MIDNFNINVNDAEDLSYPIPIIKVVGVGGAGQNAVNHMIDGNLEDVTFIAINTDKQALSNSKAKVKIQIGTKVTKGLGAGANPELGEKAAEEDQIKIKEALKGSDLVFITAGMGGGTGTGAAPIVAKISKEIGALTVAVVTKPFKHEGKRKIEKAEEGIKKLRQYVDTLIVIPNDRIGELTRASITFFNAFAIADDILRHSVQGLADLLTKHGYINVDFQDVKTVMKDSGYALMGIGEGTGENRVVEAVTNAITNNLIENATLDGAKSAIVNIECGDDFQMTEYNEVMNMIAQKMDPDAFIIPGVIRNDKFKEKEKIRVTIIATGFSSQKEAQISKELLKEDVRKAVNSRENFIPYSEFETIKGLKLDIEDVPSIIRNKTLKTSKDSENGRV
jgi:cell division protein FtsZ